MARNSRPRAPGPCAKRSRLDGVTDIFSEAKRSEVMSRIRSRGNKDTELALVRVFRAQGITGWRRHQQIRIAGREARNCTSPKTLTPSPSPIRWARVASDSPHSGEGGAFRVRPDFVFPKLRLAVFVDGCFWHCCPMHATKPRHNATFWRRKLATNKARDRLVTRTLRSANWRVLRLWEHELARKREARLLRRIRRALARACSARTGFFGWLFVAPGRHPSS